MLWLAMITSLVHLIYVMIHVHINVLVEFVWCNLVALPTLPVKLAPMSTNKKERRLEEYSFLLCKLLIIPMNFGVTDDSAIAIFNGGLTWGWVYGTCNGVWILTSHTYFHVQRASAAKVTISWWWRLLELYYFSAPFVLQAAMQHLLGIMNPE